MVSLSKLSRVEQVLQGYREPFLLSSLFFALGRNNELKLPQTSPDQVQDIMAHGTHLIYVCHESLIA